MSFRIHKYIEGLDRSQKCILDNPWNSKSDIQKLEALNALSFHFKQINNNLYSFPNLSSSYMHCILMDTNLESFNCRKISKESKATFSKSFQNEFQNKSPKLSNESLEFQKSRFSFFKQKNLNLPQDLRQIISQKVQVIGKANQEHIMQFFANCITFGVTIQGMCFIWHIHYGNTNNEYPKFDPLCKEIPLEMHNCKCVLTYSICKANCGPAFFTCVSTQLARLVFICEKLIFEKKLESPLILFFLKGK